jgi:hypothetical protein
MRFCVRQLVCQRSHLRALTLVRIAGFESVVMLEHHQLALPLRDSPILGSAAAAAVETA